MNRYDYNSLHFTLANYVGKRDNAMSDDCSEFEKGLRTKASSCDTDGHYMCDYCKHNKHQNKEYYNLAKATGMWT